MEQDKKICTVSTTQHFYFKLTAPNGIAIVSSRCSLQNVLVVLEMFQITCTVYVGCDYENPPKTIGMNAVSLKMRQSLTSENVT